MKKLTLVLGIAGLFALSSCSTSYSCDCGFGAVVEYEDLSKDEADVLESTCTLAGCDWSKN